MKVGILGSGMIVHSALSVINQMKTVSCEALWYRAGDEHTAESLKEKYQIENLYSDLDAFLKDAAFEVVYVGVINSAHYEYAKKALEAGKHVICEKPFTSNAQQAIELVELAKAKDLFLFEAVMLRYLKNYRKIQEKLEEIGEIKLIQCNYSQYSSRYSSYKQGNVLPAFNPALSGGSLYDINVYNIHFVVGLFGKPEKVHYFANIGFNGIDTSGVAILEYPTFKVVCCGAKDSDSKAGCQIQGEKGYFHIDSMAGTAKNVSLINKEATTIFADDVIDNPMENEFSVIEQLIGTKDYEATYSYMEKSVITMTVLEECRKQAGIHFAVDEEAEVTMGS